MRLGKGANEKDPIHPEARGLTVSFSGPRWTFNYCRLVRSRVLTTSANATQTSAPGLEGGLMAFIDRTVEIAADVKDVYGAWTAFERYPEFMETIETVSIVQDRADALGRRHRR